MQPRHRSGEAEAQARARLRTALFEPHKAFDRTAPVGHGDARTAVGDFDQNMVALGRDHDRDGRRDVATIRDAIFDGVVDQVGERLGQQFAVAAHRDGRRPRLQRRVPSLRPAARKAPHAARDSAASNSACRRGLAGFGARDHQQRVEGLDQFVGFVDRGLPARRGNRLLLGRAQRLLGAVAQPVSGVFRSWAMLSETSLKPRISASIRSSMH
jgi:hypothetical protein